jgi:signal transduction histidine kinase
VPDVVLTLLCAGLWAQRVFLGHLGIAGPAWVVAGLLLPSLGVLVRRRHPLTGVLLVWVPVAVQAVVSGDAPEGAVIFIPAVIVNFALGRYASRRQMLAGFAVMMVGGTIHDYYDPFMHPFTWDKAVGSGFFWLVGLVVLLLGAWLGERAREHEATARAAAAEQAVQRVVTAERARIARELHDVIAHDVNVVVVQSVAAQGLLDVAPERVRGSLEAIERSGRDALDELRRLLGFLREDGLGLALAPQPTLDGLESLLRAVREAGLDVALRIEGDRPALPSGLELAAYRIVQEALTNALKHAGPASATVTLRYESDAVSVEVVDDGGGRFADGASGGGHGLVGMQERALLYGGAVDAGRRPEGGFRVRARLPLQRDEA